MSFNIDNGINFGDDEYIAVPGEVPGLIKDFRRPRTLRPEEIARARQYGISVNTPCSNDRNAFTYSEDRYGTQTLHDLGDMVRDGYYYDPPHGVSDPKYRHDETHYFHHGEDGKAYPMMRKGCVRGRKHYREGIDAVPGLDKNIMNRWQPSANEWGGIYAHQERFTPGALATMSGQDMLIMLLLFIVVAVLMYHTVKISEITKTLDDIQKKIGINKSI